MEHGFAKSAFMDYLENTFSGLSGEDGRFAREMVEKILDYGFRWERVSKDQLVYWLVDMLPEVDFGEVAAFIDDKSLTKDGQWMKYHWIIGNSGGWIEENFTRLPIEAETLEEYKRS